MAAVPPRLLLEAQEALRHFEHGLAVLRGLVALLGLVLQQVEEPDRWITPKDAAARLSVHRKWLDRRWRRLPYCHPLDPDDPTATGYRVSERELVEHMKRRVG